MLTYLLIISLTVLIYVTLWFAYGQRIGKLDVADEAWGLAQPFIVLIAIILSKNYSAVSAILFTLTLIWGYRLFYHLRKRHAKSQKEDQRYTDMREQWKRHPRLSAYTYVFLLQGLLMYLLGLMAVFQIYSGSEINPLAYIGLGIWLLGFIIESIADRQLQRFVTNPANKGKIMDQGLWKYSRHPNYFGELTMWWGIFIFVFINTGIYWMILSPLIITYLIVFVSGIPLTEKHFEGNPLWGKYKAETSALVPWPIKK